MPGFGPVLAAAVVDRLHEGEQDADRAEVTEEIAPEEEAAALPG